MNMKMIMKKLAFVMAILALCVPFAVAQKIDEERMRRDIEVAENVLSTLIKHEISSQRTLFPLDVKGNYQEGYGVTFRLPDDHAMPMIISGGENMVYNFSYGDDLAPTVSFGRSAQVGRESREEDDGKDKNAITLGSTAREKRRQKADSVRDDYNNKLVKAAKDFIVDYGDFMTQLGPDEKIVVTNRRNTNVWYFGDGKRTHLSVEGTKADILAFKQGKISREQALAKLKVINTESVETKEADLELLSSIFSRLYRPDLSKTFFIEGNLNYERLKDYGVIYYMPVYSSRNTDAFGMPTRRHNLPTIGLEDVDQTTRDKKVTELYPKFEQELKENMLEYGRTLKTLGDEESLVFNVTVTKCDQCGIPSTLELSVKGSVLKSFGSGKIDKAAGLTKFTVKKGPKQ